MRNEKEWPSLRSDFSLTATESMPLKHRNHWNWKIKIKVSVLDFCFVGVRGVRQRVRVLFVWGVFLLFFLTQFKSWFCCGGAVLVPCWCRVGAVFAPYLYLSHTCLEQSIVCLNKLVVIEQSGTLQQAATAVLS